MLTAGQRCVCVLYAGRIARAWRKYRASYPQKQMLLSRRSQLTQRRASTQLPNKGQRVGPLAPLHPRAVKAISDARLAPGQHSALLSTARLKRRSLPAAMQTNVDVVWGTVCREADSRNGLETALLASRSVLAQRQAAAERQLRKALKSESHQYLVGPEGPGI